jgi:hypothetical protein
VTLEALEESAVRLGVPTEFVIAAAIWDFSRQDTTTRQLVVSDFWLRGLSKLEASARARRPRTFKETVHALVAHYSTAFRRRPARTVHGRARTHGG